MAISNDLKIQLELEAAKKSVWTAILLNVFLPGSGYFYAGKKFLGVFLILISALLYINNLYIIVWLYTFIFVIDSYFMVKRYNRNLITNLIKS